MMLFYRYFITLLYIAVGARATEYTSSGDNCSHQPKLGTVSKDSYYGSVDASCPRPLKPWRSLKAPCKPKVNLLMPKAEGTWYKASPTPVWLSQCTCLTTPYARCMYSDPINMDFKSDLQTAEGLYNWEPKECALPRLTAEMARQCLSHKSLAFVGDSVTRYQYVSLAYWLSKAAQLDPFADNVTIPSLAHEYQWPDWPTFWRGLVQALSCATDAEAQATCNGHRNSVSKAEVCCATYLCMPLHLLKALMEHAFDLSSSLTCSLLQTIPFTEIFERHELRLHFKQKSSNATVPARLLANMAMKAPDYRRNLQQSLEDAMRNGRPDILVLNGGIWYEGKHAGYPVDNMTDAAKKEFLKVRTSGGWVIREGHGSCHLKVLSPAFRCMRTCWSLGTS